jgi:hypothetical protein
MIKRFNDPQFLLEVFYDYNEEVDGTARQDEMNRDKFNEISQLFKSEFNMAKKLQKDKALFINKKNNKV